MKKILLDLCSGLEGVSSVFREAGYECITVDINPEFNPTFCVNIIGWHYAGPKPLIIWASPDCREFAKDSMPMTWACNRKKSPAPDVSLMLACLQIIREVKPRYWVIENVKGAIKYFTPHLGHWTKHTGNQYLWGEFPPFDTYPKREKEQIGPSKNRPAIRSKVPREISRALIKAIEFDIGESES